MPALTSARTWAGYAAAYWPSLNIVARNPFCRNALSSPGVCAFDGPSSKVSPTYPPQVAACAGAAATTLVTASAAARIHGRMSAHRDVRVATALVTLGREDHVVLEAAE